MTVKHADAVNEPILCHTCTGTGLPTTGDNALYYHRNQQYSIIGLTNAAGTLVERYSYTAYGTLGIYDASGTVRTTSTYANRYTYTGREYDPDLNLYHCRARWYDASTGGFISRDPLGYVDGMSLYRGYFGVKRVDSSGTLSVAVNGDEVVARMPGIGNSFGEIYKRPDGTCCYLDWRSGRPEPYPVGCPNGISVFMWDVNSPEFVDPLSDFARTKRNAERKGDVCFDLQIPSAMPAAINAACAPNCISVLFLAAHGNANATMNGGLGFNGIGGFFGGLTFCRPCYIVLNSCQTGNRSIVPNRIPFAAKVAQATGCWVFAPEWCLRGFWTGATTSKWGTAPRHGRGVMECFSLFDPSAKCRYWTDYPK